MPVCVPLANLQNTCDLLNLVDSEGEVLVTNNGTDAFRCVAVAQAEITPSQARRKLQERMRVAKNEVEEGKYSSFDDVMRSLR